MLCGKITALLAMARVFLCKIKKVVQPVRVEVQLRKQRGTIAAAAMVPDHYLILLLVLPAKAQAVIFYANALAEMLGG